MIAGSRIHGKRIVEAAAVLGVYFLFLLIGVYSGQTTMNVDIISPQEGMQLHSAAELIARVTLRGVPVPNATARFTIHDLAVAWTSDYEIVTDADGLAKLILPVQPGNYTWSVTASKIGYPTIVSPSRSFSTKFSLVVYGLLPSSSILAVSPVDFRVRVTDVNGRPVASAKVTFYVDSTTVGSSTTGPNGLAKLSCPVGSGTHTWFASASKDGEGGISDITLFVVGQPASFATVDLDSFAS